MSRQGIIFGLVALSMVLSLFVAGRGEGPTSRAQCIADRECQKGERCVVVPKPDGFVTLGQCGEVCEDDTACANGWACGEWAEQQGRVVPAGGLGPQTTRVKVCAHRSVKP